MKNGMKHHERNETRQATWRRKEEKAHENIERRNGEKSA